MSDNFYSWYELLDKKYQNNIPVTIIKEFPRIFDIYKYSLKNKIFRVLKNEQNKKLY